MDARELRVMADRCRKLERIAATSEVREQLRKWAINLDAEATRRVTTEQLHVCGREDQQPLTRAA